MKPEVWQALSIMGRGMLGIFVALSILYFFILLLTRLFPYKEENKN